MELRTNYILFTERIIMYKELAFKKWVFSICDGAPRLQKWGWRLIHYEDKSYILTLDLGHYQFSIDYFR